MGGYEPDIFIPKSFIEPEDTNPMWVFKPIELRYLDALHRGEEPEKAIRDLGISERKAKWLLKGKKARDYMGQLLRQRLAAESWTPDKWISEGTQVWEGKKEATREMMEAWKELGARVAPKPERSSQGNERIVININLGAAQEALKRQEIIEAEVLGNK